MSSKRHSNKQVDILPVECTMIYEGTIAGLNKRIGELENDAEKLEQKLSNYRSALETLVENGI